MLNYFCQYFSNHILYSFAFIKTFRQMELNSGKKYVESYMEDICFIYKLYMFKNLITLVDQLPI